MIPGLGRPSGEGNDNPLQYSFLENSTDKESGGLHTMGSQSQTQLMDSHFLSYITKTKLHLNKPIQRMFFQKEGKGSKKEGQRFKKEW